MHKRHRILLGLALIVMVGYFVLWELPTVLFFRDARRRLQPLNGAYQSLIASRGKELLPDIRPIGSNEWYAVMLEHSCCSGAGFDAVMIKDSEGKFYSAIKNYCGYEGFSVAEDPPNDLAALREALAQEGFSEL